MAPFIERVVAMEGVAEQVISSTDTVVFVDREPHDEMVNGRRVMTEEEFLQSPAAHKLFTIAIASSRLRQAMDERFVAAGCRPVSIAAPTFISYDDVSIGEGALISDHVLLTSNIRIGRQFQANYFSQVSHDCVIGDYVTLGPRVTCNGNVRIEDHAYIGAGAIIRQGTKERPTVIGAHATVGMGAVVVRDVDPGTTVVGNPARPIRRKPDART